MADLRVFNLTHLCQCHGSQRLFTVQSRLPFLHCLKLSRGVSYVDFVSESLTGHLLSASHWPLPAFHCFWRFFHIYGDWVRDFVVFSKMSFPFPLFIHHFGVEKGQRLLHSTVLKHSCLNSFIFKPYSKFIPANRRLLQSNVEHLVSWLFPSFYCLVIFLQLVNCLLGGLDCIVSGSAWVSCDQVGHHAGFEGTPW